MWKTGTEISMAQMLMTTERTMPQRTSPLAWHCCSMHISSHSHRLKFFAACHTHLHAIHVSGCLSSHWTPLSTSQLSSCLSSSSLSSTSATSSSRSTKRRSWKACATPPTTGWGHLRRPLPPHRSGRNLRTETSGSRGRRGRRNWDSTTSVRAGKAGALPTTS